MSFHRARRHRHANGYRARDRRQPRRANGGHTTVTRFRRKLVSGPFPNGPIRQQRHDRYRWPSWRNSKSGQRFLTGAARFFSVTVANARPSTPHSRRRCTFRRTVIGRVMRAASRTGDGRYQLFRHSAHCTDTRPRRGGTSVFRNIMDRRTLSIIFRRHVRAASRHNSRTRRRRHSPPPRQYVATRR